VIGPRSVVYQDQYQQIYKVNADFGEFTKEYFVREGGERAGIVAVRNNSVLLVKQYRLLINGLSLEIPGGRVDDGELPEDAAVRECLEETGVRCLHPNPLIFYQVALDITPGPTHIFYSDQISNEYEPHHIHQQEVSGFRWVPLNKCMDMIFAGDIVDSFTITGLLAYRTQAARR